MAVFKDHLAVVLRITLSVPTIHQGRGYWKVNVTILQEKTFRNKIQRLWEGWAQLRKYYPDMTESQERESANSLFVKGQGDDEKKRKWRISTTHACMTQYVIPKNGHSI
jgi:hypothetical protein